MRLLFHILITKLSHLCHVELGLVKKICNQFSAAVGLLAVERKMKLAALVQLAFNPNFLLMQVYDLLHYAQAKTSVSILAFWCMRLMKSFENQCFLIIRNSTSSITHIDRQGACFGCRYINRYHSIPVTIIDGVADQVIQHSLDQPEVCMH